MDFTRLPNPIGQVSVKDLRICVNANYRVFHSGGFGDSSLSRLPPPPYITALYTQKIFPENKRENNSLLLKIPPKKLVNLLGKTLN